MCDYFIHVLRRLTQNSQLTKQKHKTQVVETQTKKFKRVKVVVNSKKNKTRFNQKINQKGKLLHFHCEKSTQNN